MSEVMEENNNQEQDTDPEISDYVWMVNKLC